MSPSEERNAEGEGRGATSARGTPVGLETRGRFIGRRAKKPKQLAVITDACTGCAGAPVCQPYCPVEDCMVLVTAADAFPFERIVVDALKCVGCRKCLSEGPADTFLDGCPWNAIKMMPTETWEESHGRLAY